MCPESLREGGLAHPLGLGPGAPKPCHLPHPPPTFPALSVPSLRHPHPLSLSQGPYHRHQTPRLAQVSRVLAALQAGNRGTQACITAASAVSGIIADLDTTIMFATAGTLNREGAETFADHR